MSQFSSSTGARRIAALGFCVATLYESLKQLFFPRITILQSHIVTILFITGVMFVLGRYLINRERKSSTTIRAREEFSHTVIESLPALLCIFDADGKFVQWNTQLETLLGYSKSDLANVRILDTVVPEDRERVENTMRANLSGETREVRASLLRRDGTSIFCRMTGTPIMFQEKPCILGIAMDISGEKKAQDQLRLQITALKAAANGIVITNRRGIIEWVNPAFTRMTGYSGAEAVGQSPRMLRSGKHDQKFYEDLWSTISAGNVWQGEVTNCRKDGSLYVEEMTITPMLSETGEVTNYIAIKHDVTARKEAERNLQQAEENYRNIFEQAIIGIFRSTPDGHFLMMNPAMAKMLRCDSPSQALGRFSDIAQLYGDPAKRRELQARVESDGTLQNVEYEFRRHDGSELWLSLSLRCVYGADGKLCYYEGSAEDITERKLLERQLRQAQKMEAVGRLAGGVAHDFNNMLGIINGYSELLSQRTELDADTLRQINEINSAGKRAAALTQQLLAFSRKQIAQPRVLDLNDVVNKLAKMLRRLIGEDIELLLRFVNGQAPVKVDPGQMEQVIMNLTVNARDAMPQGGKLMIETDTCELDQSYSMRHRPVRPGRYVRLTITDTGCGMSQETLSHLFEPFFTTKELGRGTGLGLSIVYGIVKQSEGYIWAYSEPEKGTSFKVYLPLQSSAIEKTAEAAPIANVRGSETVLVVEDDEALRSMEVGFLKQLGYCVIEAQNGERALEIAASAASPIHALITDIVMPKMSGRELASQLVSKFPQMKVLYTSGYTHDAVVHTRVLNAGEAFLQKPFALSELSQKLRSILENEADANSLKANAKSASN